MTSLAESAPGCVTCVNVAGDGPAAVRLKRLGICEGRQLEIIHTGDPMILRVVGTRIGVSKKLAGNVIVEPIADIGKAVEAFARAPESVPG